jgi:hypothetical protein
MNIPPFLCAAILTATAAVLTGPLAARPLGAYLGVNRLIVISLPEGSSAEKLTKTLAMNRRGIEERDLKIIDVSEGRHRVATALRLSPRQTHAIRRQLGLGAGEPRQVFILIGKDGGEKALCHGTLDLEKWFVLIDGMPMRRAEIRDQTKSR